MIKKTLKISLVIFLALLLIIVSTNKIGYKRNSDLPKVTEVFKPEVEPEYISEYIYILDREDKTSKYEKNANEKAYPASLTKVMTVLVALEHIEDISQIAPVDVETYKRMVDENASMAGFYGRENTTFRDLLYGTMLPSGGEAANSLAINISGSIDEFVKLMNEKAIELGLKNTHFTNAEGLHDNNQYTTAKDMATLLDYALNNSDFKAIFTSKTFTTTQTPDHPEGIVLESTVLSELDNVEQNDFQIIGGKSGTTYEAGQCWITLGIKNNHEYITVVMGAPLIDIHSPDMSQMRDSLTLYKNLK